MALYRVGATGLKILRPDHTYVEWPPGAVVSFVELPSVYQGELTKIRPDPKHGIYEDKRRRPTEDKETT